MKRSAVHQKAPAPGLDMTGFPDRQLPAGSIWHRQHRTDLGPWWFSSVVGGVGRGRFDLPAPHGTCYLASSADAAVRELVGPDFTAHGLVPTSVLDDRHVSRLTVPVRVRAADLDDPQATGYRVTRELPTMTPYGIPQAWAAALKAAGFDGLVHPLRFSPGSERGLSLFGIAGDAGWPGDPAPDPVTPIADRLGYLLIEPPDDTDMTFL